MLVHLCEPTELLFCKLYKFKTSEFLNGSPKHSKKVFSRLTSAMTRLGNASDFRSGIHLS